MGKEMVISKVLARIRQAAAGNDRAANTINGSPALKFFKAGLSRFRFRIGKRKHSLTNMKRMK